jgi:hypothetical protein
MRFLQNNLLRGIWRTIHHFTRLVCTAISDASPYRRVQIQLAWVQVCDTALFGASTTVKSFHGPNSRDSSALFEFEEKRLSTITDNAEPIVSESNFIMIRK